MSSNVSGSSNLLDLQLLVSNLLSSVNNISSAFSTVQTNISALNIYDTLNTLKVNEINILDGELEQEIEILKNENISDDLRLDVLLSLFPITNVSILNESISKVKILNLTSDLSTINTSIITANNRITDLNTLHVNDVNTLTTNLNNQISKEAADVLLINTNFNTLTSSVPGSQNTFQNQIDIIKSNQLTDQGDISTAKSNISILQGDNTSNKSRLGLLESDNSVNKSSISSLLSNLTTANNNITTNTSNISTLNTNLSSLINKEASDVANLQSQINSLSTTSTNGNSSLLSLITTLSSKQTTDYNELQGLITTNKNTQIADKSELNGKISDNLLTETNHYNSLNTALNNLTTKLNNDNSAVQSNLTTYIGSNNTRSTNNETDISNLQTNVNTNNLDISSLKTDNTTNKNNISTLQSKVSVLEADNSTSKANITSNTNEISTINSKINVAESSITNLLLDVNNCKTYDLTNTTNINNINNTLVNHTTDINLIKNTTIPNLDNKFLIKNDPLITENILGKLKVDNLDSINGTLTIGQSSININIGSTSNNDSKIINIGGSNDVINILGSVNNVETTNTKIKNKVITLNDGSVGDNQAGLVGIQIRDNDDNNKGYIYTSSSGNEFLIKPPQNENEYKIGNVDTFTSLTTKLYVDLQTSALQSSINSLINTSTELNNQITTINNATLDNIPYSKINAYPSTVNYVLLGNGSFSKVNNNVIDNNTINPNKLTGSNGDANKYLSADGTYKTITSLTSLNVDLNANNFKITNLLDPLVGTDALNYQTMTNLLSSLYYAKDEVHNYLWANYYNTFQINNRIINPNKLLDYPSDGTKYLSGDGSWKVVSGSGGSSFDSSTLRLNTITSSGDVSINNFKLTNVANPYNLTDAVNLQHLNNLLINYYYTKDDTQNYLLTNYYNTFQINNRIINPDKILDYPSDGTKYLSGDGSWKVVSGGGSSFDSSTLRLNNITSSANVSINNFKLTNVVNPTDDQDASTKLYVDNKYLNVIDSSALIPNNSNTQNVVGGGQTLPAKFLNCHNTLNMDSNKIINVLDPTSAQDVATKNYTDTSLTYNLNNNSSITSRKLNLNAPELTSLKVYNTPSTDYDVVNKIFLQNYNKMYISGDITTETFVSSGITIGNGPVNILISMVESTTQFGGDQYYNITIFQNYVSAWDKIRYFINYTPENLNSFNRSRTVANNGEHSVGAYNSFNNAWIHGSQLVIKIIYNVIHFRTTNKDTTKYKYHLISQI